MTTDIRERVAEVVHDNLMQDRTDEQGWVWTIESPDDLIDALLEAFPQLAEEPEWEYALGGVAPISGRVFCEDEEQTYSCAIVAAAEVRDALDSGGFANAVLVRRRRAGHWEVVE